MPWDGDDAEESSTSTSSSSSSADGGGGGSAADASPASTTTIAAAVQQEEAGKAAARPPAAAAQAQAQAQGPPRFVDILQHLPLDVVFLVEVFLPVPTLLALSAVNRAWRRHLGEEAQWRRLFDARWSHCYEGQGRLTLSPSILAALTGNYRSFWGTIEKAFMGDYSIVGGDGDRESDSILAKLFKLLQPWAGNGFPFPFALPFLHAAGADDDDDAHDNDHDDDESDVAAAADGGAAGVEPEAPPAPAAGGSGGGGGWGSALWGGGGGWGGGGSGYGYYTSLLPYSYLTIGGGGGSSSSSSSSSSPSSWGRKRKRPPHPTAHPTNPYHLPPSSSWKLACVLRDRAGGGDLLLGCRLCRQLDIHRRAGEGEEGGEGGGHATATLQPRTWVVPCRCPALVHRRCLEQRVLLQGGKGQGRLGPARGWISYDTAAMQQGEEEPTATPGAPLGLCPRCGCVYTLGFRLPTLRELVAVTWQDELAWKRAGDCVVMWLVGVAIVSLSEALYLGRGDLWAWPKEGGQVLFWWMFQYVISLHIFFSPRFARVVDLLWLGPVFRFYARLYLYFLLATFSMLLAFTPLPGRILGLQVSGRLLPAWLCTLLGWLNFSLLFLITAIVIFLFWKTNYRIPTVADLRHRERPPSSQHPMLCIGLGHHHGGGGNGGMHYMHNHPPPVPPATAAVASFEGAAGAGGGGL